MALGDSEIEPFRLLPTFVAIPNKPLVFLLRDSGTNTSIPEGAEFPLATTGKHRMKFG
jgi:hypothetical protein